MTSYLRTRPRRHYFLGMGPYYGGYESCFFALSQPSCDVLFEPDFETLRERESKGRYIEDMIQAGMAFFIATVITGGVVSGCDAGSASPEPW